MLRVTTEVRQGDCNPSPGFELQLAVAAAASDAMLAVYGGHVRLALGGLSLGSLPLLGAGAIQGGPIRCTVFLPLPHTFVRKVMANRASDGSVEIRGHAFITLATVHRVGAPHGPWVPVSPTEHAVDISHTIHRDQWLALLAQTRFDEVEIFELPKRWIQCGPELSDAIALLRQAEQLHRNGDFRGCLARCREAYELLVTVFGETNDVKSGSRALWAKLSHDDGVRAALNEFVVGTSKLLHLGRHAKEVLPAIGHDESLLALRQTLALFEYVGRRLYVGNDA